MAEIPTGGAGGFVASGAGTPRAGAPKAAAPTPAPSGADNRSDFDVENSRMKADQTAAAAKRTAQNGSPDDSAPDDKGAAPVLGAGGTSAAATDSGDDAGSGGGLGGAGKAAGIAAAAPAAAVAGQAMVLAMFINYLKGMTMALMALAANLWGAAFGLLLAGGKAVVGAVMGIGSMVSGAVGGAISAVAAGVSTVAAGVSVVAVVAVGVVTGVSGATTLAQRDELISCEVLATRALDAVENSEGSVDAKTLENAKTIYGVLSAWGMPDENIAGIVGNWDAESGVDPTSVQNFFNDKQVMTDEKEAASADTDNGIGLGQWTFGRNQNLRDYATNFAQDWWTLDMQLGFMLSPAEGSDANIVKGMIADTRGTPTEAALYFHDKWERSDDTSAMKQRRGEKATSWMGLFGGWTKNTALADSILLQSGSTLTGANSDRAEAVRSDCRSVETATGVGAKEGGLTLEEATELIALYKSEGESFLRGRYGAGGPGDCGFGKADNCVGFSTYFANKYTSFQQYAMGNGINTAGSMARATGKALSKTPTVNSVASGPGSGSAGHTFVVLGIQGDQAVIGEAACGTNHRGTRARLMPLSQLTNGVWSFVDMSDLLVDEPFAS